MNYLKTIGINTEGVNMAQTKEGAIKAREAILKRLGSEEALKEHYSEIGRKGGRTETYKAKGFAHAGTVFCNCEIIDTPHTKNQCWGVRGGKKSKRGPALKPAERYE